MNREAEGFDVPAVEAWIANNVDGLSPPFNWTKLQGGHSNLTYRIDDTQGNAAVVRRPPQGELLPKAHDMSREWSLISALGPTKVPVPAAIGFCEDPAVTGAWFYVMGLVDGRPLYNVAQTREWVPEQHRQKLAYSFFDVLADLHSLEPDDIGLGELGKKDSYVGRQLKTWYRSWTSSSEAAGFDDDRAHELQRYLLDNLPEQGSARVVHGDYGLHNCLIGADATVVAVVDWEISTLGDPLADLAYALNPWLQPGDEASADLEAATAAQGFPTRQALAERYAQRSGRSLDNLDYYVGFNGWKTAAIVQGVYARYRQGNKSASGTDLDALLKSVEGSLAFAERALNRL
ncbi:MAG: aminoglycoside phosphotransferase (APT) family kinase protein [Bacteroidia bacterium]